MGKLALELESRLVPGETLLAVVDGLGFSFTSVPHVLPTENYPVSYSGVLALTDRRLIAVWREGAGKKWLYIPALSSLSERPLRSDRSSWPHQAILVTPVGMGMIVQTRTPDKEHGEKMSALLIGAFMTLGTQPVGAGAMSSIVAHEEEQERRRRAQRRAQQSD